MGHALQLCIAITNAAHNAHRKLATNGPRSAALHCNHAMGLHAACTVNGPRSAALHCNHQCCAQCTLQARHKWATLRSSAPQPRNGAACCMHREWATLCSSAPQPCNGAARRMRPEWATLRSSAPQPCNGAARSMRCEWAMLCSSAPQPPMLRAMHIASSPQMGHAPQLCTATMQWGCMLHAL